MNSTGPSLRDCRTSYQYLSVPHDDFFYVRHEGVQEWTVPETSMYEFQVYGANGGNPNSKEWGNPGKGAFVYGDVWLTKGEKIYVSVGHEGFQRSAIGKMAFGGGGYGRFERWQGWSGGGLTFVSTVPSPFSNQDAKTNLFFLAGGGGGPAGAHGHDDWDADGGDSSYPDGRNGENTKDKNNKDQENPGGKGGTKFSGGLGGGHGGSGSYGLGGNGSDHSPNGVAGGGGGGGLYGGGAGSDIGGGGGGGSSWINTRSRIIKNYGGKTRDNDGQAGKVRVRKL